MQIASRLRLGELSELNGKLLPENDKLTSINEFSELNGKTNNAKR